MLQINAKVACQRVGRVFDPGTGWPNSEVRARMDIEQSTVPESEVICTLLVRILEHGKN